MDVLLENRFSKKTEKELTSDRSIPRSDNQIFPLGFPYFNPIKSVNYLTKLVSRQLNIARRPENEDSILPFDMSDEYKILCITCVSSYVDLSE